MTVIISPRAKKDLADHKKSGNQSVMNKIDRIFKELEVSPYQGTGRPKALKYEWSGFWSRRIDEKNRVVYSVDENTGEVFVISAKDHYNDK